MNYILHTFLGMLLPEYRIKIVLLFFLLFIASSGLEAQYAIQWDQTLGGDNYDAMTTVRTLSDNSILFGGSTSSSSNGDISGVNLGYNDYWVGKLDPSGNLLWEKNYGGNHIESLQILEPTADGGFILGGMTKSEPNEFKSEPNYNPFAFDYWIMKIDASGNLLWEKNYGGDGNDMLWELKPTTDGGFVVVGNSFSSNEGDRTTPTYGESDYWVLKLDANGNKEWDRAYGGDGQDWCLAVELSSDGNCIIGGNSNSGISGVKDSEARGFNDYWVLKIDLTNGDIIWQKSFGGEANDECHTILASQAGGFLLGGFSASGISDTKSEANYGHNDYWVIRIDENGNKIWDRTLGGDDKDQMYSLQQNDKGCYLLGGLSSSSISGTKTQDSKGEQDFYYVLLNDNGMVYHDGVYGGESIDDMYSAVFANDGGFIFAGLSNSDISGDKTEPNHGPDYSTDIWMVKTVCDYEVNYADIEILSSEPVTIDATDALGYTYVWDNGAVGASQTVTPLQTTTYEVTVTNVTGCTAVGSITVNVVYDNVTYISQNTCNSNEAAITTDFYNDGDSVVITEIVYMPADTTNIYFPVCDNTSIPSDTVYFTNQYGCDSLVITTYTYVPPVVDSMTVKTCDETLVGVVRDTLTGYLGCDSISIVHTVYQAVERKSITAYSCDPSVTGISIDTILTYYGCDSLILTTTSIYEAIEPTISVEKICSADDIGVDTLIFQSYHGCDSLVIYRLIFEDLAVATSVLSPSCSNSNDGRITIDSVNNGSGPYLYALDGGDFQTSMVFNHLIAGRHELVVQDVKGCEYKETINVQGVYEFLLDLGESEVITLGESFELAPDYNQPIDSFYWTVTGDSLDCETCLEQVVTPSHSASYQLTVINEDGCKAEDTLTVRVKKERPVYIPNAFSPNNDGVNDYFYVQGGNHIQQVKSFKVFNRWGAVIFSQENVPANQVRYGWDGSFKTYTESEVYVYVIEIEFIDGYIEQYQGDVTLLR